MAGMEGFEPPNAWTKTRCLTTWPHPITLFLTIFRCLRSKVLVLGLLLIYSHWVLIQPGALPLGHIQLTTSANYTKNNVFFQHNRVYTYL